MSVTRLLQESVVVQAPLDPLDMVKAVLLELQSPDGARISPIGRTLVTRCHTLPQSDVLAEATLVRGRFPVRDDKGMSGAPKSSYYELGQRNVGLPTGGDPYGNGVPIVVRDKESLLHGEGGQVPRQP
jgi:hypothetical protein